jgi:predicted nucleotidyltransferase
VFSEIRSLIAKTAGVRDAIRSALVNLGEAVEVAFVYGSVARQQERAESDVDVMVLGEASFADVVAVLAPAQLTVGREINPAVFSVAEFRAKLKAGNHFLRSVLREEKLFVVGTQNELAKLAPK